ncbi:MAG: tRNA 2-thiouridine synthesizing protein [Thermacetogenium sp.]|jgi:tRNA 2-thiouridine synthesizing protein A|nr:tRNA 2-thiouridine synthesizing protein [Thermacetogenium sp.]
MPLEVDARGLSCPIPVVKTKKAMESNPREEIIVLLDSNVSKENVLRLADSKGYRAEVQESGGEYRVVLLPGSK